MPKYQNRYYSDKDKKRIKNNIKKNFNTAIIGILATIEEYLGPYWGHGQDESNLSESQEKLRNLWQEIRTEILDKGNDEMRAAMTELDQYKVKWTGYHYEFRTQYGRGNNEWQFQQRGNRK